MIFQFLARRPLNACRIQPFVASQHPEQAVERGLLAGGQAAAGGGGAGSGFDQVMAGQGRDKAPVRNDKAAQPVAKDKPDVAQGGKKEAADKPAVADDGNTLPADEAPPATADVAVPSDVGSLDASLVAGQVTDAQPGAQLLQAQAEAVAPVLQAAIQQPPVAEVAQPLPEQPQTEAFDPDADPLANLPTLRLALEQSAQAKGTTSTHAAEPGKTQPDDSQAAVNPLATLIDKVEGEAGKSETGDKAFASLLEDGLKDTKSASSDTRVDDFANRLASLTQAVTAKTANAVPVNANPLHQPLQMNQGAWAEGLVNRVMYLSSQNLKSADIQLEPAELGRLDIRVNVATDQSTQITFVSGHAGVRDALDSQVYRLRELFAQQGWRSRTSTLPTSRASNSNRRSRTARSCPGWLRAGRRAARANRVGRATIRGLSSSRW